MTPASGERSPDFFLIGAAKCGTTALAQQLAAHPQVFMSRPKEPNFFAFAPGERPSCRGPADEAVLYDVLLKYSVTDPQQYAALFAGAGDALAVGEASVRYLYHETAIQRLANAAPAARLIVLLRNPVDRMHSHYHMNVHKHLEPLGFAEALQAEPQRVADGWGWDWHYQRVSRYGEQLRRLFNCFDRRQTLVLLHRDYATNPQAVWQRICGHLGIDPQHEPDFQKRALVGKTPRFPWLRKLIWDDNPVKATCQRILPRAVRQQAAGWIESRNRRSVPAVSIELRQELTRQFEEDRRLLCEVLQQEVQW